MASGVAVCCLHELSHGNENCRLTLLFGQLLFTECFFPFSFPLCYHGLKELCPAFFEKAGCCLSSSPGILYASPSLRTHPVKLTSMASALLYLSRSIIEYLLQVLLENLVAVASFCSFFHNLLWYKSIYKILCCWKGGVVSC